MTVHHPRIGRTTALAAVTAALVVTVAAPAWAQPTASPSEVAAGTEGVVISFAVPEHEGEEYDETATVIIVTPTQFTLTGCATGRLSGWSCEVAGRNATFTAGGLALGVDNAGLSITVTTPTTNGTYAFPVSQRDGDGTAVNWQASNGTAPTVTVVDGEEPTEDPGGIGGVLPSEDPSPEPSPSPTAQPSPTPGPSTSPAPTGTSSPSPTPSAPPSGDGDDDDDTTAPTRTQGRASGGSIEVTTRSDDGDDDPALAQPDVADDDGTVGGAGGSLDEALGDDGDGGGVQLPPWQTLVGGAMMLTAGGVAGARAWKRRAG